MPVIPTYPGVYIEEIPSGVRTITGVATSITAFIGRAKRGLVNEPVRIQSFSDFDRQFGGLWTKSTMSYAVQQYFLNGGQDAIIVRVHNGATTANLSLSGGALVLEATSPGEWGSNLRATIDHATKPVPPGGDNTLFNLTIQEFTEPASGIPANPPPDKVIGTEVLRNLSASGDSPRFYKKIIEQESTLVNVSATTTLAARPDADPPFANATGGGDGNDITDTQISDSNLQDDRAGLFALDKADLFNLLCIPPLTQETDVGLDTTVAAAAKYCKDKRAMLIVDPPAAWNTIPRAETGVDTVRSAVGTDNSTNVAVYFPRFKMADPLKENRTEEFVPCGAIAGIFARTDTQRGVWKAPAGIDASLAGVREFSYKMNDGENGRLNPQGLNCLRVFPVYGQIVWGARTLAGSDQLGSEWKYVPVRRFALFLEESLYRGTKWVVFEPNDEPLWAQIRLNIGVFMRDLFRQGAFQGKSPAEAYFVKCDKETTTQSDINRGIVNIIVGFAPLKPAEFVIIKFQQMAGQLAT
jgi:phage tail sheath protein FI